MRALFCCGVAAAAMRVPLRHPQMAILTTADLPSHAQSPQGFDAFPFAYHEELTLQIESLTNMGDGVARVELDADSRWVVFVPYVLPGELVRARVYRNDRGHSRADLLEVLKPSAARVKPACSLFGVCGGCQYQHLEYSEQLSWKRQQVSDFLTRIGGLDPTLVDGVLQPTQGSPKQLHYRSKITPHWSVPKAVYDDDNDDYHAIGFLATTNRSKMVDVSACALATDKINAALPAARERLRESLKRGAKRREARTGTLLLRDVKEGIVTEEDAEVTEVVNGFATEKDPAAIRALWTELKRAYGDEATAVQAVLRQPQIINPSYTDPPAVISRSKAVLVEYMGEEESIEVMLKNPSVLQCGERGLREVGPDEIKGFAQIASLGHQLGPQLQVALFGLGIGCVIFQILYNGATPEVQALMEPGRNIIAPLIGIFFGITVEGSRLTIVGAIFKNKVVEGKEFGVDKYGKSAAEVRAAKAR